MNSGQSRCVWSDCLMLGPAAAVRSNSAAPGIATLSAPLSRAGQPDKFEAGLVTVEAIRGADDSGASEIAAGEQVALPALTPTPNRRNIARALSPGLCESIPRHAVAGPYGRGN